MNAGSKEVEFKRMDDNINDCKWSVESKEIMYGIKADEEILTAVPNDRNRASITSLPNKLLIQILKLVGPAASACVGLASKIIYPVHREMYGKVALRTSQNLYPGQCPNQDPHFNVALSTYFPSWMSPMTLYIYRLDMFVDKKTVWQGGWRSAEDACRMVQKYKDETRKELVKSWEAVKLGVK